MLIGNAAGATDFYQNNFSVGRDAAIKPFGDVTVSGGDNRRHHSVPARHVSSFERRAIILGVKDAVVGNDAVSRFRQIVVRIKTGVDEGDGHSSSGKSLVGVEPERRGQNVIGLFKNELVRIDLRLRATKQLDAVYANLGKARRSRPHLPSRARPYREAVLSKATRCSLMRPHS